VPVSGPLRSIRLRLDPTRVDLALLEDELVRRGAREAHATADGLVVLVAARTHAEALARVRALVPGYVACGLPRERRWTSQKTTKTMTPTARSANAIQPQSVASS
jgi:hypothetical protein